MLLRSAGSYLQCVFIDEALFQKLGWDEAQLLSVLKGRYAWGNSKEVRVGCLPTFNHTPVYKFATNHFGSFLRPGDCPPDTSDFLTTDSPPKAILIC